MEWATNYVVNCSCVQVVLNLDVVNLIRDINLTIDPTNWHTRYLVLAIRKNFVGRDWVLCWASRVTNELTDIVVAQIFNLGSTFCFD